MGRIVDTDVHESLRSIEELLPHLAPEWHRHVTEYRFRGPAKTLPYGIPSAGGAWRKDLVELAGDTPPGADPAFVAAQLFDELGISVAILDGEFVVSSMQGWHDLGGALARAYNDWLIATWLDADERFRGSVHVMAHEPAAAAREIDRVGAHPQMVQVFLPLVSDRQYGDPFYGPIFEAALRHDLVIALHHGTFTTPSLGYPRYFSEWHATLPQVLMSQVASLVCNGVFDRFEGLKVVGLESGFTWLPHLMTRLDQQYKMLRAEIPWVRRLPSEHLRDGLRLSTQPIEELSAERFLQLVDMMGSDRLLMFSSDYPHWDFDAPAASLPAGLPADLRDRIMYANAEETYALHA